MESKGDTNIKNEYDELFIKEEEDSHVLSEVKEEIDINEDVKKEGSGIEVKSKSYMMHFEQVTLEKIISETIVRSVMGGTYNIEESLELDNLTDSFQSGSGVNKDGKKGSKTGDESFKCRECDKIFTRKVNLNRHMAIHTGQKPFNCKECDKSFTDKSSLNRHVALHTAYKPFKCNECDKRFTSNADLKRHKAIHTGHKPFKCSKCDKCFIEKYKLKIHMAKAKHLKDKPLKFNE